MLTLEMYHSACWQRTRLICAKIGFAFGMQCSWVDSWLVGRKQSDSCNVWYVMIGKRDWNDELGNLGILLIRA